MKLDVSVVIPVFNEELNIELLLSEVAQVLADRECEVIVVDDASEDGTWPLLRRLQSQYPRMRALKHSVRCGQSTAMWSGVRAARADVIGTLDGDGQNDPADLPALLHTLQGSGGDVALVAGWRAERKDSAVKLLSSRIANSVRRGLLRDGTPDTGCGIKVFYRDVFLALPYFDHMHRFLPALVQRSGRTVTSVPVKHRPRLHGQSKYGIGNRLWVGLIDLFGVSWLIRRSHRPGIEELN